MEHTLRNCITGCLLGDYLPARDATHKGDKGDRAITSKSIKSTELDSGRRERVVVGDITKKE